MWAHQPPVRHRPSRQQRKQTEKDRFIDNAKGTGLPPQTSVTEPVLPAAKGEDAPTVGGETPEGRGRERTRRPSQSRSPPPRRERARPASQDPNKDAETARRMDTTPPQNKRGAGTQGDQKSPEQILEEEVKEAHLPPRT